MCGLCVVNSARAYVYDWVEGRVHVAEPEGDGEAPGLDAVWTEGVKDVEEEEGEPAEDEAPHYEAQNQRGPLLLFPGDPSLLSLRVPNLRLEIER